MNLLIFLCFGILLALGSQASFFTDLVFPENLVQAQGPIVAAGTPCEDAQFNHCQVSFNGALGISATLNYRSPGLLFRAISNVSQNVTGVLQVCQARTLFFQCLGTSYDQCINRYYLIGTKNVTIAQGFQYVSIWKHWAFICGGGFEPQTRRDSISEAINNWDCVQTTGMTPQVTQCFSAFNATLHQDPNALCAAGAALTSCVRPPYTQFCGASVGWFACEYFRTGFADFCPNLSCANS